MLTYGTLLDSVTLKWVLKILII